MWVYAFIFHFYANIFRFLVDGSINNQFSGFLTDIVESIEMPEPEGSGGGNVSAYFYDIFTDIWISQRMVLDVARLIKENPGYKIYVNSIEKNITWQEIIYLNIYWLIFNYLLIFNKQRWLAIHWVEHSLLLQLDTFKWISSRAIQNGSIYWLLVSHEQATKNGPAWLRKLSVYFHSVSYHFALL